MAEKPKTTTGQSVINQNGNNGEVARQHPTTGKFLEGNPGRPKGSTTKGRNLVRQEIERAMNEKSASGKGTRLARIIDQQAVAAEAGDTQAFAILMSFWVGRPRQQEPEPVEAQEILTTLQEIRTKMSASPGNDWRPPADLEIEKEQSDE